MTKSVFNKGKGVNFLNQPMFFGEDLAVQRYDTMKYPIFDKLTQQQLGFFWRQKKYLYKKIETIMVNYYHHKRVSLHLT